MVEPIIACARVFTPFSGYGPGAARSAGEGWKAVRKRESILQASPSGGTRLACQQWTSGDWPGFRSVRTASGRAPLERAICQKSRQRSCGLLRYSKSSQVKCIYMGTHQLFPAPVLAIRSVSFVLKAFPIPIYPIAIYLLSSSARSTPAVEGTP